VTIAAPVAQNRRIRDWLVASLMTGAVVYIVLVPNLRLLMTNYFAAPPFLFEQSNNRMRFCLIALIADGWEFVLWLYGSPQD